MIRHLQQRQAGRVLLALLTGLMAHAAAGADPGRGEQLYQTCEACHTIFGDGLAPSLHGVFGRASATVPGYQYSDAMKAANLTWDAATLAQFIRNPQEFVKGTKMLFPGYQDQADIDAVVAYLQQLD